MQTIRNLNILILAFLLILTGCFGLADDAVSGDAEGQTNTNDGTDTTTNIGTNNPPFIAEQFGSYLSGRFLHTKPND